MKSLQHSTLLWSVLAFLLPAAAQARTYEVVAADVPFKFTVGQRTFREGHYVFVLVGAGLMAVRDHHGHVVASLITRSSDEVEASPRTRLVFERSKKKARLQKIYIESSTQVLEVVGEQLAMRSTSQGSPFLPVGTLSVSETIVGLRPKR